MHRTKAGNWSAMQYRSDSVAISSLVFQHSHYINSSADGLEVLSLNIHHCYVSRLEWNPGKPWHGG
jgi:hypothetical protein